MDVEGTGGDARLVVRERPLPTITPDDILVRVHAAGVNRADLLQRQGLYPPPKGASDIIGLELAGEVVDVGAEVRRFREGDKVCAILAGGGYSEYCAVPQWQAAPCVEGLSWQENAVVPEVWCTVWSMIMDRGGLQPHESLLVHGGSGGIGCAAIQLGGLYGKRVFATARGQEKRAYCEALGGSDTLRVIDYGDEDFVAVIKDETEGRGVDVILDMVGGDYVVRNLKCLAKDGRLLYIGFLQGSKVSVDLLPLMLRRQSISGATLRVQPPRFKGALMAALERSLWPLLAEGRVKPCLQATYALEDAQRAHDHMESGASMGKIALLCS
ncbi:MAG: NAD(P)H-quinone oxidoreductase [Alphaproteobacteria bacterium GM202ARS2]|nr:NAD(P)H-quinone oxidoreductase [Alphaproteobacteria bacterium GM202ARS2]